MTTRILLVGAAALGMLAGCGGVSEMARQQVAQSETVVRQSEATVANSEAGAIELQRAKNNLRMAREALDDDKGERAQRLANQAQLDAELAVAKAQSARARQAAAELQASIQTLREEALRESSAR